MNQVLRDKLTTLFFKYVEVASPEICLKSFKNVDIKGKTLLVGVGKASIPYCEKIKDRIKSQYEGIIISTKIKNIMTKKPTLVSSNPGLEVNNLRKSLSGRLS